MLAFGFTDRSSLGRQVKALYTRWVIYGLVLSFIPGVDIWAHLGGIAGGFVAGLLASTPRARLMWKEPLLRALAGVCIAITVVAFGMMYMAYANVRVHPVTCLDPHTASHKRTHRARAARGIHPSHLIFQ